MERGRGMGGGGALDDKMVGGGPMASPGLVTIYANFNSNYLEHSFNEHKVCVGSIRCFKINVVSIFSAPDLDTLTPLGHQNHNVLFEF